MGYVRCWLAVVSFHVDRDEDEDFTRMASAMGHMLEG